jgi:predicted ATPase
MENSAKVSMLQFFINNDKRVHGEIQPSTLNEIKAAGMFLDESGMLSSINIDTSEEPVTDEQLQQYGIIKDTDQQIKDQENQILKKQTLVINAYGGPGAGKSTAALDIVSALKKKGLVAEYVSEYAKDLVWEEQKYLLDGTEEHQRMILKEQYNRVARLIGKCDIVVTDSPILLNINYNKELTPEYEQEVKNLYDQFHNFAFVVQRDATNFEQAGRIQNLEESQKLDKEITDMLDRYGIRYGTYDHASISKVVYNATKVFYGLNPKNKEVTAAVDKKSYQQDKEKYVSEQKEKLKEINLQIKDIAMNYVRNPEQITELLEFSKHFYKYSPNNIMLILSQNKNATFIQSYEKWKEAGYMVKRGQKGLKILVPVTTTYLKNPNNPEHLIKLSDASPELQKMYKNHSIESVQKRYYTIGNVFDISQTNCPREKYPEFYSMGFEDVNQDEMINGISKYCNDVLKIPVRTKELDSISLRGYYRPGNKDITLNELLNSTEKLSTLTHELGHAIMDHSCFDTVKNTYQKEFEADCFSIMLDNHLNVPITESRKAHLASQYKDMEKDYLDKDTDYEFDKIISDVFSRYNTVVDKMDEYINDEIQKQKQKNNELTDDINISDSQNDIIERMVETTNETEMDLTSAMDIA